MAIQHRDKQIDEAQRRAVPMAFGRPTEHRPVDPGPVMQLMRRYIGASVGECYFGPAGFSEDGTPWVIFVTPDPKRPKLYRDSRYIGMLGWRWDGTPSMYVSLTLMGLNEPRPHVRWMSPSEDPAMQAIRQKGSFYCCVVHPEGTQSGWFHASFSVGRLRDAVPSTTALEKQWAHPVGGIPGSRIGTKYEPFPDRRDLGGEEDDGLVGENEIPMWADRVGDAWRTLHYNGPWTADLEKRDRKAATWANSFHQKRGRAAGFIQLIKERQDEGMHSLLDEFGGWHGSSRTLRVNEALNEYPTIRLWFIALAGPEPDAKEAHEAALTLMHSPKDMYGFLAKIMFLLNDLEDEVFALAVQHSFEAALLDTRVTDRGQLRPWLANTGDSGMELRTLRLDILCEQGDLETLWRSGMEFPDLIDAGLWFGPADLPAPLDIINNALAAVRIEGSPQEAFERVMGLLREAQDARQWSIPWGARVQLQFGPFVAMRIFEREGEFSCHFLDERERYVHVAIGLGGRAPRISSVRFVRPADDGAEPTWNEDAQVSLQLIAAAIVRDFLVVEERESLFSARQMRRQVAGRKINTVVYLPRVRYGRPEPNAINPAAAHDPRQRERHAVAHHLRRAGTASPAQRFLAQRYGISLPEGFTFVRPHERGLQCHEDQARIYRSRSASRMLFEAIAAAPEGTRPAWFQFEKDCAHLLAAQGMRVVHQAAHRDGDGGMDLFAADGQDSWVVQCKCWAPHRQVGPDVVRELVGAIAKADRGSTRKSRGMIITTSTLTSGAASEAIEQCFRIIDGPAFAKMLSDGSN